MGSREASGMGKDSSVVQATDESSRWARALRRTHALRGTVKGISGFFSNHICEVVHKR
jgi:photosystem II stability/assembly factor-like uncharacterized protein